MKGSTLQRANDGLFGNLLFLTSKEGDRVMLPACATVNTSD